MKTTTIIALAFVTFMLAEPTSALPRWDEKNCPSWVCRSDNFLLCCGSYSNPYPYSFCMDDDTFQHYMFLCCPRRGYHGCM